MSKKNQLRKIDPAKDPDYYNEAWKKMRAKQKNRVTSIMTKINPSLKNIDAGWMTQREFPRVARLLTKLCYINIDWNNYWFKHPVLRKFSSNEAIYLLHKIMKKSVNGKPCYKEMLCGYKELNISYKTVYKIIDDLVADGCLIYFPEYTADYNKSRKKNYENIRPSEEVAAAYFDVYTKHMKDNLEFLKHHTKIDIKFDV